MGSNLRPKYYVIVPHTASRECLEMARRVLNGLEGRYRIRSVCGFSVPKAEPAASLVMALPGYSDVILSARARAMIRAGKWFTVPPRMGAGRRARRDG